MRDFGREERDAEMRQRAEAMSLEELRAEWAGRPNQGKPPYEKDRDKLAWYATVRGVMFTRMSTPASIKGGKR